MKIRKFTTGTVYKNECPEEELLDMLAQAIYDGGVTTDSVISVTPQIIPVGYQSHMATAIVAYREYPL